MKDLIDCLTNWINSEIEDTDTRVRVTDLENDLFDGLVLKTLFKKLSGKEVTMPTGENVQSQERQRRNLDAVLKAIQDELEIDPTSDK